MGWLLRTFLIWLLVLAVPAQGAAAATMAFCGPDHHGGSSAAAQVQAQVQGAAHAHHGDALAGHALGTPDAADAAGTDAVADIVKASQVAEQTCSVCASCCAAGAILTTVPAVPAAAPAATVFATVVPTVSAFAADGPDRPPRSVRV